ncbi:MAG TPA: transketolase, partial [Azospirillaceae bacterium]|nr:transketolase [Azospirillaceae bacterium]
GGAHQSIVTPLIGMGLPNLASFEPAFVDELEAIMAWGFGWMQEADGGSVYLRLSTRQLEQPARPLDRAAVIEGGYWLKEPAPGCQTAIAYCGAVVPEVLKAAAALGERPGAPAVLALTSPDRLYQGWRHACRVRAEGGRAEAPVERLLARLPGDAGLVTVIDGHPASLAWLGAVRRHRVHGLGVAEFGQSGDVPDLYAQCRLDADAILDAARELRGRP